MKNASPELIALLESDRQFICADLFTITLINGTELFYTGTDIAITWDDHVFSPFGLQISGLRYRIINTLEADEQTITIAATRNDLLDGISFLDAVQQGALDGAKVKRQRAYMETWNTGVPVGVITLFNGYVSSIDAIGRTKAEIKVKSNLALLDVQLPRNKWQSSCLHTLYDSGCGLNKTEWSVAGSAGVGSTKFVIKSGAATASVYWQGTLMMTSGVNSGQLRTIKNATGTEFVLSYPLLTNPEVGDTFVAVAGCDKTLTTCKNRFNNVARNKSFPFIPTAETAL